MREKVNLQPRVPEGKGCGEPRASHQAPRATVEEEALHEDQAEVQAGQPESHLQTSHDPTLPTGPLPPSRLSELYPTPRLCGDRGPSPTPSSLSSSRRSDVRSAPPRAPSPMTSSAGRSPFPESGSVGQVIQTNIKRTNTHRSPSAASRSSSQASSFSHRSGTSSLRSVNITELLSTPEARKAMSAMVQSMRDADKEQIRTELIAHMRVEIGQRQAAHAEELSEMKSRETTLRGERDSMVAKVRSSADEEDWWPNALKPSKGRSTSKKNGIDRRSRAWPPR